MRHPILIFAAIVWGTLSFAQDDSDQAPTIPGKEPEPLADKIVEPIQLPPSCVIKAVKKEGSGSQMKFALSLETKGNATNKVLHMRNVGESDTVEVMPYWNMKWQKEQKVEDMPMFLGAVSGPGGTSQCVLQFNESMTAPTAPSCELEVSDANDGNVKITVKPNGDVKETLWNGMSSSESAKTYSAKEQKLWLVTVRGPTGASTCSTISGL